MMTTKAGDDASSLSALLKASLEAICHHLLYVRRVYNSESFTNAKVLDGVNCRFNRHPQVVQYIREAVDVAINRIVQNNKAKEVTIAVLSDTFTIEETFVFRIDDLPSVDDDDDDDDNDDDGGGTRTTTILEQLELELRDMLLSVHSLEGHAADNMLGDEATFQIIVGTEDKDKSRPPRKSASSSIPEGWYTPSTQAEEEGGEENVEKLYRQLHRGLVGMCELELSMIRWKRQ